MKCGQLLPDDARFCSRCRAATAINNTATQQNSSIAAQNKPTPATHNSPDEIGQTARLDECTEYVEHFQSDADTLKDKKDGTRQILVDAIDKLKESRSSRMSILAVLFAATLVISLCAFATLNEKGYEGASSMSAAFLSGAAALAFGISMFRVYISFEKLIEEKEEELSRYDFEYKGDK